LRRIVQILSWLIVLQGILLGMLIVAVAGEAPVGFTTFGRILAAGIAGLVPILASLVATRDPRAAARIDLWVSPIACLFLLMFSWGFGGALQAMAVFSGAIVIPGFFWLLTARRNWPPPLANSLFSLRPRLAALLGSGLFCVFAVVAFFWSLGLPWWYRVGDCSGRPLLDDKGTPFNTDFTATIVFVGPRTFQGYSLWSVVSIEERFSGMRRWDPGMVILRGQFKPSDKSKRYFVEGSRSETAFTHLLPVMEPVPCGRTGLRDRAAVAIRILHDGPPKSGARLIGRVYRVNWPSQTPLSGVPISIDGPAGDVIAVTDGDGIYDLNGIPPGQYKLHLLIRDTHVETSYITESPRVDLKVGNINGADFFVR
jgi:hypothetical protein